MQKYAKSQFIKNGYLSANKKFENTFVDTHFHDFYELEFIISGSGTYTIDGTTYTIEAGDLFFLTPMNYHYVDIKNAELFNIMFSGDICNPTFLQNLTRSTPMFLKTENKTKLFLEVTLDELCENTDNREFSISLLDSIIAKIQTEIKKGDFIKELSVINKAEIYILNNFRNTLTLNDVANEVALAPTYFSRLFKAEKNINFKAYLNNMRFDYAKKLLEHSDLTVMQICTECGFNDYPNFIRRFRQYAGVYPAEYRKNAK